MRILWVKAGGLVPLDTGGKIRSYHILRELSRRHSVTLFTFYAAHPNDAHAELQGVFSRVVCCPVELPRPRGIAEFVRYVRHSFSPHPYSLAKYCRSEIVQRLRRLLEEQSYDVIVCDFIFAAGVIPWDFPCPKVLFAHNVEALIWQRYYQVARNPFWKAVCWREYQAMTRAERHYLDLADHVLTVSGADHNFFAKYVDPEKITTIPTGVDVSFFSFALGEEESNTLVFTGSMDWLPNEDGIFYFVREILPRIRRQIPEVSLRVVGRRPSSRLRELAARDRGVEVTGEVEDIRPYLRRASIYVVPLRVGSGTRLKIFEAMATGRAVVSTSVGAEGLPVKHEENILLADEPDNFADAVVGLLRDSQRRIELGRAARRLVEGRHSWASVATHFEAALEAMGSQSFRPSAGYSPSNGLLTSPHGSRRRGGSLESLAFGTGTKNESAHGSGREPHEALLPLARGMRTLLICHEDSRLDQQGMGRWLASFSSFVGIIVLRESKQRVWRRVRRELQRVGIGRFCDVLAFRLYYRIFLSKKDQKWEVQKLNDLCRIYPELPKDLPILFTHSPNSSEAEQFIKKLCPDVMIARCKVLLKESIFSLPSVGTFVMHPGICPEYRNAHGCFWALANGDHEKVGMTLLEINRGVDTGPIYGYFSYAYDELRESHRIIQLRVVFDNLDQIQGKLCEIYNGLATPLDVTGRASATWGQPWLTRYLAWKRRTRKSNKA